MQATWSDTDSEESDSTTFKDAKYEQNDYLAFVAFVDFVYDGDSDSECECEYADEQNATFLNNLVVECQNLIKKYLKNHDILDGHKAKIELLNEKKTNYLEKIRFLESKHHSLLKRNHVLTQDIEKIKSSSSIMKIFTLELKFSIKFLINSKPSVIREVWRILTRLKLLLVEILFFVKGKEENPRQATPSNTHSLCTHCKKFRHTHHMCYTKFHERYESQLNS